MRPCYQHTFGFRLILITFRRLIFATTNHLERIDPALTRSGRMDLCVKLTNATKRQAEDIFKRFFGPAPPPQGNRPGRRGGAQVEPILKEAEVVHLARHFSDAIPEEMSVWPFFSQSPCFPHIYLFFRLLAYKGICSSTRRALRNASTRSLNGTVQ